MGALPFLLVAMGGVVQEAGTIVDAIVATVIGAGISLCRTCRNSGVDGAATETTVGGVARIEVIVSGIVDGGLGHATCPGPIITANENNVVQVITAICELVFLVGQHLIDVVGQMGGVLNRHTAVEHVREIVAGACREIHTRITEVGSAIANRRVYVFNHIIRHLSRVANHNQIRVGVASRD